MTERLMRENQLFVLRLSLSLTAEATRIVFDLSLGGEPMGRLQATPDEFGLPMTLDEANAADRNPDCFRLPQYIAASVAAIAAHSEAKSKPLWLYIDYPSGYLPLIPWERLFQSILKIPILRLPYLDIQPVTSRASLDVVICMSLRGAPNEVAHEAIIEKLLSQIPSGLTSATTLHLFANQASQAALRQLAESFYSQYQIILYDPAKAPSYTEAYTQAVASLTRDVENPWLLWIANALHGRSADVVHFLCEGYLCREKGNLSLGESPLGKVDAYWASRVDAQQLSVFLNRLGAWAVAFSSPPGNTSLGGLRLLQEQLSRLRPGPVLLHDMDQDRGSKPLANCYRFLFASKPGRPPQSAAVALSCHPLQLVGEKSESGDQSILEELTMATKLSEILRGSENTPAWIAGSQRSLEQAAAALIHRTKVSEGLRGLQETLGKTLEGGDSPLEHIPTFVNESTRKAALVHEVIRSGTENALRFTSNLLAKAVLDKEI
ncbi:hypothetical protein IVG45_10715 [Methylomonas sp. LL1]|uniref:hypothetical protein n=1 Tax=Methylomonas sp. LL1 TaxID=2785785 RepID=UPI0018C44A15|nr:hypothetical protein [Methylomonas sp. LL1]QPK65362.1 hypothetical protein IVG45_10715 [Methylomonas sp. LL1]